MSKTAEQTEGDEKKQGEPKLIKPFLKWAGGKLRIVSELKKRFPTTGKRFIEPFLGAGSVSLNVDYPQYIVNDFNRDLTLAWKHFRYLGMEFVNGCKTLFTPENNEKDAFYKLRKRFNKSEDEMERAMLFIYLNRHCYNGLCRYNSKGGFNTPFGRYPVPYFPTKEFEGCCDKIGKFEIYNKDFREIFDMVERDDVVYCDPPYIPISASANFNSYSAGGFSLRDQVDLAECAIKSVHKGATVIISNHHCWTANEIYTNFFRPSDSCNFNFKPKVTTLDVSRTISSKTEKREPVKEVIVVFNPV